MNILATGVVLHANTNMQLAISSDFLLYYIAIPLQEKYCVVTTVLLEIWTLPIQKLVSIDGIALAKRKSPVPNAVARENKCPRKQEGILLWIRFYV